MLAGKWFFFLGKSCNKSSIKLDKCDWINKFAVSAEPKQTTRFVLETRLSLT